MLGGLGLGLGTKATWLGLRKDGVFVSLITDRNNPDVSSEISGFGTTNTTGKCPDFSLSLSGYVLSKTSGFLTTNIAGKCPHVSPKVGHGWNLSCLLKNIQCSCH